MASLKLTTLASVKAYWQTIATKHKQIAGAYFWGTMEVVKNANLAAPKTFLWAQPFETFRYSGGSDNVIKNKPITIAVFTVAASNKFTDEEAAYDFCEAIIEDIVSKLMVDKRGVMGMADWEMIATNISTWKGKPVQHTIGSTKYIGCEFSMEYMDNTNFAYDPSKWN